MYMFTITKMSQAFYFSVLKNLLSFFGATIIKNSKNKIKI